MSRNHTLTVRSMIRTVLLVGVVVVALVTSFVFSMWLSRMFSPSGEWLQNGLTAFGLPIAWLMLTLLYASLMVASTKWVFRLLWPKPHEDGHE